MPDASVVMATLVEYVTFSPELSSGNITKINTFGLSAFKSVSRITSSTPIEVTYEGLNFSMFELEM